jgi:hypothetical protein
MDAQDDLWTGLKALVKPALQGAGISAMLLATFLLLNWARMTYGLWMLVPVSTIAVGGAGGGVFCYMVVRVLYPDKLWAKIFSILIFAGACFLGLVFGLSLTGDWD